MELHTFKTLILLHYQIQLYLQTSIPKFITQILPKICKVQNARTKFQKLVIRQINQFYGETKTPENRLRVLNKNRKIKKGGSNLLLAYDIRRYEAVLQRSLRNFY